MAELRLPVSARAVAYHAKETGCPVVVVKGVTRYQWPDYLVWYHQRQLEALAERMAPSNYEAARAREMAARAEMAEIELATRRGQMVAVADVTGRVASVLERVRARITAIPGKLAPRLVGTETATEAQVILQEAVREVLTELATGAPG